MENSNLDVIGEDNPDARRNHHKKVNQTEYATKKTIVQGMMDIALIAANANQLRYLIEFQTKSPVFYPMLALIILSLLLQAIVGICLIFKGRLDLKGEEKLVYSNRLNNYVMIGVFLITLINIFITSFNIYPNPVDNYRSNTSFNNK